MDAAAPGWSRSSDPANRASTRAARSAESRSPGIPQRLADRSVQPFGQMAEHVAQLVYLAPLHHPEGTEDIADGPGAAPARRR